MPVTWKTKNITSFICHCRQVSDLAASKHIIDEHMTAIEDVVSRWGNEKNMNTSIHTKAIPIRSKLKSIGDNVCYDLLTKTFLAVLATF